MGIILGDLEVKVFKALAHPIRLQLIKRLRSEIMCVCELNKDIQFSQSNLSQHLKILKEAGILESHKKGLWIHYGVKNREILKVIDIVAAMIKEDRIAFHEE